MSISHQDIEAELSYAYLHAVSAAAGFECCVAERIADKDGIDARVHAYNEPGDGGRLTDFSIAVQLKASYAELPESDGRISYGSLKVAQYNKLRKEKVEPDRFLVLLRLPKDPTRWLRVTSEQLVAEKCAYWVSLRSAPPSVNEKFQTVYLPTTNLLDVEGLKTLMQRVSREEVIGYDQ